MERMGVTAKQALAEDNEIIETAFLVWHLDEIRQEIEAKKAKSE